MIFTPRRLRGERKIVEAKPLFLFSLNIGRKKLTFSIILRNYGGHKMVLVFKMFLSSCDERVSEKTNKRYMVECLEYSKFKTYLLRIVS